MPLFSPSLHGIAGAITITAPAPALDRIVFADVSTGRAVKTQLARHAQEECFIFGTNGLSPDQPTTNNFTVSTVTPALDIRWPFNWTCTGVRTSVTSRPAAGTAAGINVFREGVSIFTDTTTVAGSFVTIATGAGNPYSSVTSPHANHVTWTKGDRIRMYITAGATGSGNVANNFHSLKIMLIGYRR